MALGWRPCLRRQLETAPGWFVLRQLWSCRSAHDTNHGRAKVKLLWPSHSLLSEASPRLLGRPGQFPIPRVYLVCAISSRRSFDASEWLASWALRVAARITFFLQVFVTISAPSHV